MTLDPGRLALLVPNWLGDAVMALPAIADVRRRFPQSGLVVAARAGVADLFALVPDIDEVVTLRWKGKWWDRRPFLTDATQLSEVGADVAILFPNSFAAAWLARHAGIPERWGYATDLRTPLLSRAVARPGTSVHQGEYYQRLTAGLGIPAGPLHPALHVPDAAMQDARARLLANGWDGRSPLVVLAAGAAYGTAKRWIPDHVATLAAGLIDDRQATCVLVGSRADAPTMDLVRALLPTPMPRLLDLTGQTTLTQLAAVLSLADVCVSNDSGAMHVAGAVGTALVALFGPTREKETAPLVREGGRAEVLTHQVFCRPCMLRECPIDHRCMTGLTPDRVRATVDLLLEAKS